MKRNIMSVGNSYCLSCKSEPLKEVRQYRNYISFLLCFVLFSNIVFASEESFANNKQSELEQLKIEVERLKAKKAELENENKKLNNILSQKTNEDDIKLKEHLKKKLSELKDKNNKKENELKEIEKELKNINKQKIELNIKNTELKKDLESRKQDADIAETVLKEAIEENNNLSKKCEETEKKIKEIEDNNKSDNIDFEYEIKSVFKKHKFIIFKIKTIFLDSTSKIYIFKNGNTVNFFGFDNFYTTIDGYVMKWDLKDLKGKLVESGTYEAVIYVDDQIKSRLTFQV